MITRLVQEHKRIYAVSVKETEQHAVRWREDLISWPDQVQFSTVQLQLQSNLPKADTLKTRKSVHLGEVSAFGKFKMYVYNVCGWDHD